MTKELRVTRITPSVNSQTDRFTLKTDIYCEHFGDDPFQISILGCKALETTGIEPYKRRLKATEKIKVLDLGDISRNEVGYIVIVNTEGTRLRQNPSKEEKLDIAKRIVDFDGYEVYPYGMPFIGQPSLSSKLEIRCLHGEASLQVYILPR